jgi:hypothetical protein
MAITTPPMAGMVTAIIAPAMAGMVTAIIAPADTEIVIIPTVAMGTMPTVSGLTLDTIRIQVTAIPREGSDIGEKMHGIIAAATSIITNARMGESL